MGIVSITRTDSGIRQGLEKALELIGGLQSVIRPGDRVLLKPNLNGLDGSTSRELMESLIQLVKDLPVKEVFIAESTFGDHNTTRMFFRKSGFVELADRYGIRLVNLNESEAVNVRVENGRVLESISIAREYFEADRIINIPNMKVHYATGVSLAMKNLKGLLVGDEKKRFHEVGLDDAIVDLNNTVRTDLNIIDCISCMEKMGPHGGDLFRMNLLVAGCSIAEVDVAGSRIMGYELSEVKHLDQFIKTRGIDPDAVEVTGLSIDEVRRPFRKARVEGVIPDRFRIHNRNACSTCEGAFLLSCRFLEGELTEDIDIYMGPAASGEAAAGARKIAFGNCCPDDIQYDRRIRGCPPYPFLLRDCLKQSAG